MSRSADLENILPLDVDIYDLVIIGAGSAGISAAKQLQKTDYKYLLVEHGEGGTTCAQTGCMPSKALIEISKRLHQCKSLINDKIINSVDIKVDTSNVLKKVRHLRDHFVEKAKSNSAKHPLLRGHAEFVDANTIDVDGRKIYAKSFILACGSRPRILKEFEKVQSKILTTDNIFELEVLPSSIAIIGIGVIGIELMQAFLRLGVKIQIFEEYNSIAGIQDEKVLRYAVKILQQKFPINFNTKINNIVENESTFTIEWSEASATVDQVLLCVGRESNLDQLKLERLGIDISKGIGNIYNPNTLQVGDFPLYVAGDASSQNMVVHEASEEARIAIYNATHIRKKTLNKPLLHIVFTDPPIARIGSTLKDLSDNNYIVGEFDFSTQGRALIMGQNDGIVRIYVHPGNNCILGAEMIAPGADNFAHILMLAIQHKLTIQDLLQLPVYHPVLEEGLRLALVDANKKLKIKGNCLVLS